MTIVVAIGIALIIWSIALGLFFASVLRRRGEPRLRALRSLLFRPTLWLGVTLVVAAVDATAAAVLLAVFLTGAIVFVARRRRR